MNKNQSSNPSQLKQKVDELMTRDPVTVSANATLNTAAHLMWTFERSCLPVTDDDGLVLGMITDRDVSMCAYTQGRPLADLPVHLAMQKQVICARSGDERDVVEALMEANELTRLPVIDEEGRLVGIVSHVDLDGRRPTGRERFSMMTSGVSASEAASGSSRGASSQASQASQSGNGAASLRS